MKRALILAAVTAASLASAVAKAEEVKVTFDDNSQQAAFQMPALLDQCVAGLSLRGDPTVCKSVSAGLNGLRSMVAAAQKEAADAKAAADKAAADKAAADKPAAAETPAR